MARKRIPTIKQGNKAILNMDGLRFSEIDRLVGEKIGDGLVALCVDGVEANESRIIKAVLDPNDAGDGGVVWLHVKPEAEPRLPEAFMPRFTGKALLVAGGGNLTVSRSRRGMCRVESVGIRSDTGPDDPALYDSDDDYQENKDSILHNAAIDGVESLLLALVGADLIDPADERLIAALNEAIDAIVNNLT